MAAPRLPFLWPMLWKSSEAYTPAGRCASAAARSRAFHRASHQRQRESVPQRYGSANGPPPHLGGGKGLGPRTHGQHSADAPKSLPKIGEKLQKDGEAQHERARQEKAAPENKTEPTTADGSYHRPAKANPMLDSVDSRSSKPNDNSIASLLDSIPDPAQQQRHDQDTSASGVAPEEERRDTSFDQHPLPAKARIMETPRYAHNFDSYGLVRRLADSGWEDAQAITIMKSVRLMLAENMDLARDALVSKSMVENETYLFRAACAELKTEVIGRRKAEQEKMRTERNQLQHEVDILSQRLGQESGVLKDELKGMFDDRKMAVRNEQRSMESKIQQLNYKITVSLQADARSEIEGLRWVMTRRVIITLGIVVIMVLGSLKLYSNSVHEKELEEKKRAKMKAGDGEPGPSGGERPDPRSVAGGELLIPEAELSAVG